MGQRKYPPLKVSDVVAILLRWGFVRKSQEGSHAQYEGWVDGQRRLVTVDTAESGFDEYLIGHMLRQSGLTREKFYGATKRTAKKAGVPLIQTS